MDGRETRCPANAGAAWSGGEGVCEKRHQVGVVAHDLAIGVREHGDHVLLAGYHIIDPVDVPFAVEDLMHERFGLALDWKIRTNANDEAG